MSGLMSLVIMGAVGAQSPLGSVELSQMTYLGESEPLRQMNPDLFTADENLQRKRHKTPREVDNFGGYELIPSINPDALPAQYDPIRQAPQRTGNILRPIVNTEAIGFNGIFPPDPSGAIGQEFHVSMVNTFGGSQILIQDKAGNEILGPFTSTPVFWEPFGIQGFGDPIVFYDQEAKRWILTEFADFTANMMLMAVSTSESPLGSWHIYFVSAPGFPDYPKFGKWADSYFITTNEVGPEIPIYLIDREALLVGDPNAPLVRAGVPKFPISAGEFVFQVASPIDWIGSNPPPEGDPLRVVRMRDDSWGDGSDAVELWEFDIDWDDPSSLNVTGPKEIELSPFSADLCAGGLFDCIQNPNGQTQSVLAQVIMNRPVYRRLKDYESILLNFSVDVNSAENISGIRWVELRRQEDSDWFLYQEGTWSPDDDHRFMASCSMDRFGNILMGYAVLGPQTFPSLRYTGRRVNDPLGEMTISEGTIIDGQGSNTTVRWGDYFSMTVDPVDEETFWFLGEYMGDDFGSWSTRLTNFRFTTDSTDIAPAALSTPNDFSDFAAPTDLVVAIQNLGEEAVVNFDITVEVDGQFYSRFVTEELAAGDIQSYLIQENVQLDAELPLLGRVFTSLGEDQLRANDTLHFSIEGVPLNDIGIVSTENLETPLCDAEEKQFEVLVSNRGYGNISDFLLTVVVNDMDTTLIPFNGFIAPFATERIDVTLSDLVIGDYDVLIYTSDPNGVLDDDTGSDTLRSSFVNTPAQNVLTLTIQADGFPTENSWVIRDSLGQEVIGANFPAEPSLFSSFDICLPDGCYSLTVFDSYGDGICCGGGFGQYVLLDNESGLIVATGDEFAFEKTDEFCLPYSCSVAFDIFDEEATPGESDGIIFIVARSGVGPFQYSIDGGATFQDDALFSGLSGDSIYTVVVMDLNGCDGEEDFYLGLLTSTAQLSLNSSLKIYPNPTAGEFFVELTDFSDAQSLLYDISDIHGQVIKGGMLYRYNDRLIGRATILDKPAGVYYIVVKEDGKTATQKLIYQD